MLEHKSITWNFGQWILELYNIILKLCNVTIHTRVESGSDDPNNLGHLGQGQVGLIRKLNYLDVTRISHAHLKTILTSGMYVSEWILGLMNAPKYHWCETSLLSQAILKHVVSKDFIFKKSVQETGPVACQEWRVKGQIFYQTMPMSYGIVW